MTSLNPNPSIRDDITVLIKSITPFDPMEKEHQQDVLAWIASGEEIFRVQKPDVPKKHLSTYFVLVDTIMAKILLVDHKKAQGWIPAGGHVEYGEHPTATVEREIEEELFVKAEFIQHDPFFVTITTVSKPVEHTDVSLWYILNGDSTKEYCYDHEEFCGIQWFSFDDIPYERTDEKHMGRFIRKLHFALNA